MILVMTAQVATAGPALPGLPAITDSRPCAQPGDGGDVVVCGRRDQERFRLRPLPEEFERPSVPKAETSALGGVAAMETESATLAPGVVSNRLMFRFKLPF